MTKTDLKIALSITASVLAVCGQSQAFELSALGTNLPPVDFHGFISQGYIWNSGHNDYLGGDSHNGTPDFREYGFNGSMAYGKWRVGGQFFGEKLGPYGDDKMRLDWADVDYQATQWFGVRAGRVKMPRGLYNETLDLDSTRAFVLLPQSVYDARLRDFQASFDGGMIYGNVDLKKAGSLDYKVFGGNIPMSTQSGASDYFNIDAPFPNLKIGMDDAFGANLFWNTPVQGFRVGYTFSRYQNLNTLRFVPPRNTDTDKNAANYDRHLASAEYTVGNFVFAAEGGFDDTQYELRFPPGYKGDPRSKIYGRLFPDNYYYYVSASWRANHWLELGAYYSYWHWDQTGKPQPGITLPSFANLNQGDYALAARFDVTDNIIFKIEAHYMDGAGLVLNVPSHPQPPSTTDKSWVMLTAKVTFSF